jgi:diguanylate cyclase (GGDEF)-like protein/PAS domain S-box-containing protein
MDQDARPQAPSELAALRARLDELEETLRAIRRGEVDALVVSTPGGERVYTLMGAEEPYRVVVEAMTEGAVTFSADGTVLYCNTRFAAMVKTAPENVIGASLERFIQPSDRGSFSELVSRSRVDGGKAELSIMAADGAAIPVIMAAHHVDLPGGGSIVAVVTDLTEIRSAEDKLRELSIRDALTGLFNRRYLDETLERELARAQRERLPVSVVMMDIDLFKEINDRFGHKAGDAVLQFLGEHLHARTRLADVPCRYGGEEFVLVLPDTPLEAAYKRAEEWRAWVDSAHIPYGEERLHVALSMGVAAYPVHGATAAAILTAADRALYAAKEAGRNRVQLAVRLERAP